MGLTRIIALDLGKFKAVARIMNAGDRSHAFETIEMSPTAVDDLLVRESGRQSNSRVKRTRATIDRSDGEQKEKGV